MRRSPMVVALGLLILCGAALQAQDRIDGDGFALRNQPPARATPLLKGLIAAAFNETHKAEKLLPPLIAKAPKSPAAAQAREALIGLYFRQGAYRQALRWIDSALAASPDDAGLTSTRVLAGSVAKHPDQRSTTSPSTAASHLREGNIFVSVRANKQPGEYILDSGASISVTNESEARRLGMKIESADGSIPLSGAAGGSISYRLATLDRLEIGGAALLNVAFMVVSDDTLPFAELPKGQRAILGIPVLLGLRTMRIRPTGEQMEIGFASQRLKYSHANLCFDGPVPLLLAAFQDKELHMSLDTGGAHSDLYSRFGASFAAYVATHGRKGSYRQRGVDGSKQLESIDLDEAALSIDRRTLLLRPAHILDEPKNSPLHGRLGMDALFQAKVLTLDWGAMRLRLE
ncbi:MAG TPA: retropepsin-like aspartic protease [Bryobacteraceae bacterium]